MLTMQMGWERVLLPSQNRRSVEGVPENGLLGANRRSLSFSEKPNLSGTPCEPIRLLAPGTGRAGTTDGVSAHALGGRAAVR